jgi:hypothetical protein
MSYSWNSYTHSFVSSGPDFTICQHEGGCDKFLAKYSNRSYCEEHSYKPPSLPQLTEDEKRKQEQHVKQQMEFQRWSNDEYNKNSKNRHLYKKI